MKSSVVIGANFGDEGKGLMTDYLCRKHNADIVIRFNGGSQAGHTVVTPEGKRHVFSHIGSGYFVGVPTYLSEYFILNPITFRKEYEELCVPDDYKIYLNGNAIITTYWDMLASRFFAEVRGDKRHRSCGLGINETIQRCKSEGTLDAKLMDNMSHYILRFIERDWLEKIENACGSSEENNTLPQWVQEAYDRADEIDNRYVKDVTFMMSHCIMVDDLEYDKFSYAIFEGAQGLGLDQFYGNYPYVSSSNTGMRNVLELQRNGKFMGEENFSIDEIVYVSRTYETRHGDDPNFGYLPCPEKFEDKTNVPNEFQGDLRFQYFQKDEVAKRIEMDIRANNLQKIYGEVYDETVRMAFTHLDQHSVNKNWLEEYYIPKIKYESKGETHKDVVEFD
jgi:adenylosuccinate synthase